MIWFGPDSRLVEGTLPPVPLGSGEGLRSEDGSGDADGSIEGSGVTEGSGDGSGGAVTVTTRVSVH